MSRINKKPGPCPMCGYRDGIMESVSSDDTGYRVDLTCTYCVIGVSGRGHTEAVEAWDALRRAWEEERKGSEDPADKRKGSR